MFLLAIQITEIVDNFTSSLRTELY